MVRSRVRVRPSRSATLPNTVPPMAQPMRRSDVRTPVQKRVALRASGEPIGMPSSAGTQLGATKLNSRPSKTSKPHPSHAAKITVHWYAVRSQTRRSWPNGTPTDMSRHSTFWRAFLAAAAASLTLVASAAAQAPSAASPAAAPAPAAAAHATDLDALVERALERRNETWRVLHDYVLDERERFALNGP